MAKETVPEFMYRVDLNGGSFAVMNSYKEAEDIIDDTKKKYLKLVDAKFIIVEMPTAGKDTKRMFWWV